MKQSIIIITNEEQVRSAEYTDYQDIQKAVDGAAKAVGESAGDLNELLTVNAASFDITYANGETAEVKVPDDAKKNAVDGASVLESLLGSASGLQ